MSINFAMVSCGLRVVYRGVAVLKGHEGMFGIWQKGWKWNWREGGFTVLTSKPLALVCKQVRLVCSLVSTHIL